MAGTPPVYRVVAKHKESGKTYEVAVVWENKYSMTLAPVTEPDPGQEGRRARLPLADACDGSYWLNVYEVSRNNRDDGF